VTPAAGSSVGDACVVVTGAPAAGKTTISRRVAERLPRAAVLNADFVHELIVSGFVWGLGEPPEEAARQASLTRTNLCSLAVNFSDAGFTPVIDALITDRAALDEIVDALAARPVLLVVLSPSIEAHRERNEQRAPAEQFFFADYEALTATMRREYGDVGWWFDTTDLTAAETGAQIVEHGAVRARIGG
jgi:predicted kinase